MDDEQREWQRQFWGNLGGREFIRFAVIFFVWFTLGIVLTIILRSGAFFLIFFLTTFGLFPFVSMTWKPAYSIFRLMFGNKNLPLEPMPRSLVKPPAQKLPWYAHFAGLQLLILGLILLYIFYKYFFK
jgi:hypothetical protein